MVCCVPRSIILKNIVFHRTVRERMHVKYSTLNIVGQCLNSRKLKYQNYSKVYAKATRIFSQRNFPAYKVLFCSTHDYGGNETDSDSEEFDELHDPAVIPEEKESIHDILATNDDPLIIRLKLTSSIEEIFGVIHENETTIKGVHIAHAILALWDLQKSSIILSEKPFVNLSSFHISETFVAEMIASKYMEKFLVLLKDHCGSMTFDELSCSLLYLGKLGFADIIRDSNGCRILLQQVVLEMFNLCSRYLKEFSLPALSRFMVATRIWGAGDSVHVDASSSHDVIKQIALQLLERCDNAEDFRLVTICIAHLKPCLDLDSLEKYKNRTTDLVSKGVFKHPQLRPVVKAAAFLNLPHWSHLNIDLIRMLLLLLKNHVKDLKASDVVLVNRLLQNQMEPAELMTEVQEAASKLMQDKSHSVPMIDLLSCLVPTVQPSTKTRFEEAVHEFIYSSLSPRLLPVTFKVLRNLKTSNVDLCDAFWSRMLDYIKAKSSLQGRHQILRYCHWYMHFNNNLGGTYHHHEFETCMSGILLQEYPSWNNPSSVARAAAFIIAYNKVCKKPEVVANVTREVIELVSELTPDDCFLVSHGLRIALGPKNSAQRTNKNIKWLWSQLARKLDYLSEEKLKHSQLTLRDLNMLTKAFIERKVFNEMGSVLSEQIAEHHYKIFQANKGEHVSAEAAKMLSSRLVKDMCSNMLGGGWLFPTAAELICNYVTQHALHLTGETIERIMQVCFLLNHWPEDGSHFFSAVSRVLIRDKERLSGLSLLQISMGLCYFNALPIDVINYIFAVDFLEKVDDEIRVCYAKAIYPLRIRLNLMELNRAVSLGYPEADVPWFHKNYCESMISMESSVRSHTQRSVYETLLELLGGDDDLIQERAYSPYYHKIDFLIVLDESKHPISPKKISQKDILAQKLTRVAVILRGPQCYCQKFGKIRPHLRGLMRFHEQHLQLLGYDVVGLPVHFWDSMQMASPEARIAHLKERIFGDRTPIGSAPEDSET